MPPGSNWVGGQLDIHLDRSEELNAFYIRKGRHYPSLENTSLCFHRSWTSRGLIYTGESPQIVWHEFGHAVLDAVRPEFFQKPFSEVAAFHESFADLSAVLTGLSVPKVADRVIDETRGRLLHLSDVTRIAPQMGQALDDRYPDRVMGRCLRTPVINQYYRGLKKSPPISSVHSVSLEPHNLSRVFSAAVLHAMDASSGASGLAPAPTADSLVEHARYVGKLLVATGRDAPAVVDFYASAARTMVWHAHRNPGPTVYYPQDLIDGFKRFGVLTQEAAGQLEVELASGVDPGPPAAAAAGGPASSTSRTDVTVSVPVGKLVPGHSAIDVVVSADPRLVLAAGPGVAANTDAENHRVRRAVVKFIKQLITLDRLGIESVGTEPGGRSNPSHMIVGVNGRARLERRYFD